MDFSGPSQVLRQRGTWGDVHLLVPGEDLRAEPARAKADQKNFGNPKPEPLTPRRYTVRPVIIRAQAPETKDSLEKGDASRNIAERDLRQPCEPRKLKFTTMPAWDRVNLDALEALHQNQAIKTSDWISPSRMPACLQASRCKLICGLF